MIISFKDYKPYSKINQNATSHNNLQKTDINRSLEKSYWNIQIQLNTLYNNEIHSSKMNYIFGKTFHNSAKL